MEITVNKAFTLQLPDQTKREFELGVHDVEEKTASHWYVRAHCAPVKPKKGKAKDGEGAGNGEDTGKETDGKKGAGADDKNSPAK